MNTRWLAYKIAYDQGVSHRPEVRVEADRRLYLAREQLTLAERALFAELLRASFHREFGQ